MLSGRGGDSRLRAMTITRSFFDVAHVVVLVKVIAFSFRTDNKDDGYSDDCHDATDDGADESQHWEIFYV